MRIHRDSYEGTEFDMTKGLAAGPFGTPTRWGTRTRAQAGFVGWERSIAIFRCAYCVVLQCRDWLPDWIGGIAWFAEDNPKTACFVPFYAGNTKLPKAFEVGGRDKFERESAFWAFNFVANWAEIKFSYIHDDIQKKYSELENEFYANQPELEKKAVELFKQDPKKAQQFITEYSCKNAQQVVDEWWNLSDYLIAKYSDGYINLPKTGQSVGYPEEWLEKVEFGKTKIIEKK